MTYDAVRFHFMKPQYLPLMRIESGLKRKEPSFFRRWLKTQSLGMLSEAAVGAARFGGLARAPAKAEVVIPPYSSAVRSRN
jgi:hypothetical protein